MVELTPEQKWAGKTRSMLIAFATSRSVLNTSDSPNKTAVLNGLVDIYGRPVGRHVITTLVLDPAIKRLVIMGQPGAGKTTTLSQIDELIYILLKDNSVPSRRAVCLYDDALWMAARQKQQADTPEFNTSLVENIRNPKRSRWLNIYSENDTPQKEIVLAEIPAVGYGGQKDRGVSAVETLARETEDTFFLYLVAHPLSQLNALAARFTVAIAPEENIVEILAKKHNIIIETGRGYDPKVLGRRIKNAVRWTAKAKHVKTIIDEMSVQFHQWHSRHRDFVEKMVGQIILPESYHPTKQDIGLLISNSELLMKTSDQDDTNFFNELQRRVRLRYFMTRVEAAHAKYRFEQMGVPENRYNVAFNPYQQSPIHIYIN